MAEDLNLIHFRLTQERERLTEELEHIEASNRPTGDTGGSWFGKRDEQANKVTESRKQQKVEHALHKFDEGTYSFCDSCGQSIDPARLEALPYTTLCLNCKALQERQSR
jgi:RNA polymerase-binding transcription factor DksA